MGEQEPSLLETQPQLDLDQIIEIRDPEIEVEEIMARIRANVARRRAEGAYQEDLDAIAQEVFSQVVLADSEREQANEPGTAQTLAELDTHWMIREQPFVSHVPILGRLIVLVRNLWNWMSTKWYVRPLVQQQVGFNALAVRALRELNAEHQFLAREVHELSDICDRQGREIDALRRELEQLRAVAPSPAEPGGSKAP
jgi:O-antigen chain-terminating methyltransferase